MESEDNSIFDEINEELKHDEVLAFLKKHQNTFFAIVVCIVLGIVIHSSWYSQKQKRMEVTTTNLFRELYSSGKKSDAAIENLLQNAPSELVPLLSIIKSGRKLAASEAGDLQKNLEEFLTLSEKKGIDIVWKDLAVLIYCSYKLENPDQSIKRLEPIAQEGHPFRFTAMEHIAMLYETKGDHKKSIEILTKITEDKEAPKTMKERISKLINYIKNTFGEN